MYLWYNVCAAYGPVNFRLIRIIWIIRKVSTFESDDNNHPILK